VRGIEEVHGSLSERAERLGEAVVVRARVVQLSGDAEDPGRERRPGEDKELDSEAVEEGGLEGSRSPSTGAGPKPGGTGSAAREPIIESGAGGGTPRAVHRRSRAARAVPRLCFMSAGQPAGRSDSMYRIASGTAK
jgi:hypothetical protein